MKQRNGGEPMHAVHGSRKLRILLLAAIGIVVLDCVAMATIDAPVKIRLAGDPILVERGKIVDAVLIVEAAEGSLLSDWHVEGQDWSVLAYSPPDADRVPKSGGLELRVRAIPLDPDAPLWVNFELDGRPMHLPVSLSPRHYRKATQPSALSVSFEEMPGPGVPSTLLPRPAPFVVESEGAQNGHPDSGHQHQDDLPEDGLPPAKAARNIRVHGRFVYFRTNILPTPPTTTIGVDGATVRILDDDTIGHDLLATTTTDVNGYFDVTFLWDPCPTICETQPDIVVEFQAANGDVEVEVPILENTYKWVTGEWHNYTGTDLNVATNFPSDEADNPALHILTNAVRTHRWFLTYQGLNTPPVDVIWPASGWARYSNTYQEIHMPANFQWSEAVLSHEYGHHFIKNFAVHQNPSYCNDRCNDSPPFDCNHCAWCNETDHDAWSEGFPDWLGDIIPNSFTLDYGIAPLTALSFETSNVCATGFGGTGDFDDPTLTEGFLAALLTDIADSDQDDDAWFIGRDRLALGSDEIIAVVVNDDPLTPLDFLDKFASANPSIINELWSTAANVGYDIDVLPPSAPTGVYSTTHSLSTPSSDPTPQFMWDYPVADDASGVGAFSIVISPFPQLPDETAEIGDQNYYDAPITPPGTWYFNIRSRDLSGKWSTTTTWGPFEILTSDPIDLQLTQQGGWDHPLVPRDTGGASAGNAHVSATLPGYSIGTYWNVGMWNSGDLSSPVFNVQLKVDGVGVATSPFGPLAGMDVDYLLNQGPVFVNGGRHTLTAKLDSGDVIAEPNESNNEWGHQWAWTPQTMVFNAKVVRPAPPQREGGWNSVTDGSTLYYNADGYRFTPRPGWNAVVVEVTADKDDYDCRLHTMDLGTTGFALPVQESARGPGCLDAIIVKDLAPLTPWDFGVVNVSGGKILGEDYELSWIAAGTAMSVGDVVTADLSSGAMIGMHRLSVGPAETGVLTVGVRSDTPGLHVLWFDQSFASGGLDDATVIALTDERGRVSFDVNAYVEGSYGVAIFRDPKEAGSKNVDADLTINPVLPDLAVLAAAGWYAPLVPRPAPDGTMFSVPAPASLPGNATSTYFNLAVHNDSPTATSSFRGNVFVDGVDQVLYTYNPLSPFGISLFNDFVAREISGGRHTLTMRIDSTGVVEERDEENNQYGEQWIWSPLDLINGIPVSRPMPAGRIGGWEDLTTGSIFFNSDGLRMADYGRTFQGVAAMPGALSNVDLRMHELSTGAQDGFSSTLSSSGWGIGLSDFVLVNYDEATPRRAFDVGVLEEGAGSEDYTAHSASSVFLDNDPTGEYGPLKMEGGIILSLHEVGLNVGTYSFELVPIAGEDIDWGISLHPIGEAYMSKSTTVPDGLAWHEGIGDGETIVVSLDKAGNYCLAVWRASAHALWEDVTYNLIALDPTVVDAPNIQPTVFRAHQNHPNPFNPSTTLRFDLHREAPVSLVVHDVAGRRIRVLLNHQPLSAGEHSIVWNGRDDAGVQVASGVYLYQLQAGGLVETKRMVLLK